MGCCWNRLHEPVFEAVSFCGLTGILYLEKFYALRLSMAVTFMTKFLQTSSIKCIKYCKSVVSRNVEKIAVASSE